MNVLYIHSGGYLAPCGFYSSSHIDSSLSYTWLSLCSQWTTLHIGISYSISWTIYALVNNPLHTATNLHFSLNIAMAITGLNGGEWPTQELEPREVTDRPIIEYWARICQNTADDENCSEMWTRSLQFDLHQQPREISRRASWSMANYSVNSLLIRMSVGLHTRACSSNVHERWQTTLLTLFYNRLEADWIWPEGLGLFSGERPTAIRH